MKKAVIFGVMTLVCALCAYLFSMWKTYTPKTYIVETNTGTQTVDTETGVTVPGAQTYTIAEVAEHNNAQSCYSVIQNVVHDLTLWVNLHPGGTNAILSLCGTDGTDRFMKKHKGGDKYMRILDRYKVGVITQ